MNTRTVVTLSMVLLKVVCALDAARECFGKGTKKQLKRTIATINNRRGIIRYQQPSHIFTLTSVPRLAHSARKISWISGS